MAPFAGAVAGGGAGRALIGWCTLAGGVAAQAASNGTRTVAAAVRKKL